VSICSQQGLIQSEGKETIFKSHSVWAKQVLKVIFMFQDESKLLFLKNVSWAISQQIEIRKKKTIFYPRVMRVYEKNFNTTNMAIVASRRS
jgi:hypothetical protein